MLWAQGSGSRFDGAWTTTMGLVTELKGNKYDYNIEAKFTDTTGTGTRDKGAGILGRPCDFTFTKQIGAGAVAAGGTPPA
jgi:hypothetical protein